MIATPCAWGSVLPAGRTFAAVPSRRRPVVIAERDPQVLDYVRTALLANPPGSPLPGWVFSLARQAMRVPGAWRLAPTIRAGHTGPSGAAECGIADWLHTEGHRLVVLDHSHDPDARFVLLVFPAGEAEPRMAMKVAASRDAVDRVRAEASTLAALGLHRLQPLAATVPLDLGRPDDVTAAVLVTTAQPGVPMLVDYHRRGHTRRPGTVRADFAAAGRWLARMQSLTPGPRARLGLVTGAVSSARARLAGSAADLSEVLRRLDDLQERLGRYDAEQTLVHGDFWAGNILLRDGVVSGVVDWERGAASGNPVRDLARFAVTYSDYLDAHTRIGHTVRGHRGLVAGQPGGGVGYAIDGTGWYPDLVRGFVTDGLRRLGLPPVLLRDVMLAEVAAIATEASEADFSRRQWTLFAQASEPSR
jgi:hypothetical protein